MIKYTPKLEETERLLKQAMSNCYDLNRVEHCEPEERLQLLYVVQLIEEAINKLP